MRLQPVAAQPLRRVTTRDVKLSSGHLIPAGVFVELAQYSVMRSKAWGWEDGDVFKPVSASCYSSLDKSRDFYFSQESGYKKFNVRERISELLTLDESISGMRG